MGRPKGSENKNKADKKAARLAELCPKHGCARVLNTQNRVECRKCKHESHACWEAKNPTKKAEWLARQPADYIKKVQQRSHLRHADAIADKRLQREYGITTEVKLAILADQRWACPICYIPLSVEKCQTIHTAQVDHCHEKLHVRGILCPRCNLMIGYARHNPHILRSGAEYLEVTVDV